MRPYTDDAHLSLYVFEESWVLGFEPGAALSRSGWTSYRATPTRGGIRRRHTLSVKFGWMIRPDGTITLNTPIGGYAE